MTAWLLAPVAGIPGVAVAFLIGGITELTLAYWRLKTMHGMQSPPLWWVGLGYGIVALALARGDAGLLDPWQPVAVAARFAVVIAFSWTVGQGDGERRAWPALRAALRAARHGR